MPKSTLSTFKTSPSNRPQQRPLIVIPYIYISMSNNCIFIDIYNEYFCKRMWLSAISPDVFGTSERNAQIFFI